MPESRDLPAGNSTTSPLQTYLDYCRKGKLAYQVDDSTGQAFFYPRLIAPETGSAELSWHESSGLGTVHSTTTIYRKDTEPYNVALVDVDDGFRMMSRIEDIEPESVEIGMRVRLRMHVEGDESDPYPVFVPLQGDQS